MSVPAPFGSCGTMTTLRILPKGMSVPEIAQGLSQLQHRGVGGQDVERLARRSSVEGREERLFAVGGHTVYRKPSVLEAHGHVLGPDARNVEPGCSPAARVSLGNHLEVHVPQPGDVPAVGVVVVDGDKDMLSFVGVRSLDGARDEGAQDLVETDRVLYEEQK